MTEENMSKLEELIQQYCPDGVEYVRFVDYANVLYGCPFDAAQFTNDSSYIPLIRIRDVLSGKAGTYYKGEYSHDYIIKKGDILVGMDGNFNLGIWDDIDGLLCQRVCKLYTKDETRLLNGFIRHYMKPVFRQIEESTPGGSVKHLSAKAINSIHIPLPPLPVQEEIVRVLEAFTELQAELQAELQKRKQQYNYYRDNLLSFKGRTDVEWKKLGEIASIKTGRRFVRTDIRESGVPCFHYGDIYTYYGLTATQTKGYLDKELAKKLRFAQPNDVVVVCAGENDMDIGVGVAWLGDKPAVVHDACCILHHNQSPRYISHFLRTHNYHLQMKKYVKNGKISSLPASGLAEALIPLPSFEEQERIAAILDRFDTLTTDLTQGLPAEIEKRRQQYEYYRDKLLTFKRKGA